MKIKHYSFFVLSLWPFLWCFFIYFLYDDEVNFTYSIIQWYQYGDDAFVLHALSGRERKSRNEHFHAN